MKINEVEGSLESIRAEIKGGRTRHGEMRSDSFSIHVLALIPPHHSLQPQLHENKADVQIEFLLPAKHSRQAKWICFFLLSKFKVPFTFDDSLLRSLPSWWLDKSLNFIYLYRWVWAPQFVSLCLFVCVKERGRERERERDCIGAKMK